MKFIQNRITDPYFNLALEEYLLRHVPYESCMLWHSSASVVIGKHQNALAEVNFPFIIKEKIPVIRRLSGGGAVFHSPGNLNFTMVRKGEPGKMIDFRKHTEPVISFLNDLGVPARFEGKNDLRVNGLKISGNAEHVFKNRVLHHGTLLFESNLRQLNEAIRVRPDRYIDKSVQSVRSRVGNISEFLSEPVGFDLFRNKLELWLKSFFQQELIKMGSDTMIFDHTLSGDEIGAVHALAREKYHTWEWNYGYSPDYLFTGSAMPERDVPEFSLKVRKGIIEEVGFKSSDPESTWQMLANNLKGKRHSPEVVLGLLKNLDLVDADATSLPTDFYPLFF